MLGIEVDKRLRPLLRIGLIPYLAQHARVDLTHQLLADDVHTVRDVQADDGFGVDEGACAEGGVVVMVKVEGLAEEVLKWMSL